MNELSTNSNPYQKLLLDLQSMIASGQQKAQASLNEIRLSTYWQMGERLHIERESADTGFLKQVATDLELDPALVTRIVQFYEYWPQGIPRFQDSPALSWNHIVPLLAIKDETQRQFYFEEASKQNWDRTTLRTAIKKNYFEISQSQDEIPISNLRRDPNPLHTYKAIVEKVVDGDTLLVRIDLGFNVWTSQRIRFRGINTKEMQNGGEEAKQFVTRKLSEIPFIVIKTYKTDIYGRFVADVFYHPTISKKEDVATRGFFLNEEILKSGLAKTML